MEANHGAAIMGDTESHRLVENFFVWHSSRQLGLGHLGLLDYLQGDICSVAETGLWDETAAHREFHHPIGRHADR
ncbi:hypothetical protein D3C71_2059440 [compost metagenome]